MEKTVGQGRILFVPLPLEMNDNLQAIGDVYRHALKTAGVQPTYTTATQDTGIVMAPTRFADATMYAITSESSLQDVSFTDQKSGKKFSGRLEPGRAALLLIGKDGNIRASYNWIPQ